MPIFSWSALVLGSTATEITGSGNTMDSRMIGAFFVAESIAGSGIFQTYCCCNITGINHVDFLTMVGMHLQDTANTLSLTFGRVVNVRTGAESTGVHTERKQVYQQTGQS